MIGVVAPPPTSGGGASQHAKLQNCKFARAMEKFQLAGSLFVVALLLKCCISENYHPDRTLL